MEEFEDNRFYMIVVIIIIVVVEKNFITRKQEWIVYCVFVRSERSRLNEGKNQDRSCIFFVVKVKLR